MIQAILYDLDGVLVDACEWHYLALNKALHAIAKTVISRVEHETIFNGLPTKRKLDILIQQGRLREKDWRAVWDLKQKLTIETIEENAGPDLEKIQLHQEMRAAGVISVCVTNSIRDTAKLMLEKTGQLPFMKFNNSNEMVRQPKPHGEGYIRAMIRLGLMPDEILVVEDSEKGRQAAEGAGANLLMIPGPHDLARAVRRRLHEQNEAAIGAVA
jgi:HAD superfamily hydrolase (TIGR01509 family)